MFDKSMSIAEFDSEVWAALQAEERRQEDHIELIASENYASPRVLQAQGSQLTPAPDREGRLRPPLFSLPPLPLPVPGHSSFPLPHFLLPVRDLPHKSC